MAYQPTRLEILKARLSKAYSALRGRDTTRLDQTTQTGFLLDPNTDQHTRLYAQPIEQDALVQELQELLADFGILEAALRKLTDIDEFNITVKRAVGGSLGRAKANRILQRTKKNCEIEKELSEIAYTLTGLGNAFIQIVTEGREINDIMLMPNTGFIRNTDILDQFIPGQPCFIQRTLGYQEFPFSKGQMLHLRHNHRRGQRYGNSIFFAGRSVARDSLAALRSLLPRRLANQPFRHFNVAPGKGIVFTLFQQIKNSLSRLLHIQKGAQTSPWDDVFTNNIDVQVLGGQDTQTGDLKDIELLIDSLLVLLNMSRQILGAGININRDVIDEQREEAYKHRRKIIKILKAQFLTPLFDLALSLEGISPSNVEYTIEFSDLFTDSRAERRIDKLVALFGQGMIDIVDAVPVYAPYLGIKDIQGTTQRVLVKREQQTQQAELVMKAKQLQQPETKLLPSSTNEQDENLTIN